MNKLKEKIKEISIKKIIKSIYDFYKINLKKTFLILCMVNIIIIVLGIPSVVQILKISAETEKIVTSANFFNIYSINIQMVFFIVLAGIVPYIYIPIVGAFAGSLTEISKIATLILDKGYLMATIIYLLPMLLNICIISIAVALGIYVCKTITAKYKLTDAKSMGFTKFRIDLYDTLKKKDKKEELEKKREQKIAELEKKNRKLDYFNIIGITLILFVLQIIASLFELVIMY